MDTARAYLLFGSEDYLINSYKKRLLEALFSSSGDGGSSLETILSSGDMNFNRFTGPGVDMDAVINAIGTMPFFAERRVILVENSDFFKKADDKFSGALESIPETSVVIFAEKNVDKRIASYKYFSKNYEVKEFNMLQGPDLERWAIGEKLGGAGLRITRDAWQTFLDITTADKNMKNMSYMDNELEKLISYCHGRDSVTEADVRAITSGYSDDSIFALLDGIAASDPKAVMKQYDNLILANVEPEKILHMIIWEFERILSAGELFLDGLSYKEVAARCGMQDWQIKKHDKAGHFKSFPPKKAALAIEKAADIQLKIRTGSMDAKIGCELLMNELLIQ